MCTVCTCACRGMCVYMCAVGARHGEAFWTRCAPYESSMFLSMVCIPVSDVAIRLVTRSYFTLKIISMFPSSYPMCGHSESSLLNIL